MEDERTLKNIVADVMKARIKKLVIDWTIEEVVEDISLLCGAIIVDSTKFLDGNKAAGKRVRSYTKCLETLGLTFRKLSI